MVVNMHLSASLTSPQYGPLAHHFPVSWLLTAQSLAPFLTVCLKEWFALTSAMQHSKAYLKSQDIEDMLARPWLADGSLGQDAFIRQAVQADQADLEGFEEKYEQVGKGMLVKVIWGKRMLGFRLRLPRE